MIIKVSEEFTDAPGLRYNTKNFQYSGEQFREEILYPKYMECLAKKEKLIVDLDGGYGYFSSFLEEAFGGLIRKLRKNNLNLKKALKIIEIKSNDNPVLIEKVYNYMKTEIDKRI